MYKVSRSNRDLSLAAAVVFASTVFFSIMSKSNNHGSLVEYLGYFISILIVVWNLSESKLPVFTLSVNKDSLKLNRNTFDHNSVIKIETKEFDKSVIIHLQNSRKPIIIKSGEGVYPNLLVDLRKWSSANSIDFGVLR